MVLPREHGVHESASGVPSAQAEGVWGLQGLTHKSCVVYVASSGPEITPHGWQKPQLWERTSEAWGWDRTVSLVLHTWVTRILPAMVRKDLVQRTALEYLYNLRTLWNKERTWILHLFCCIIHMSKPQIQWNVLPINVSTSSWWRRMGKGRLMFSLVDALDSSSLP